MLLIVNSMPKCGSTWFHNYAARCLSAIGHPTAREATASQPLALNERDNPGSLEDRNLELLIEAARATTFAIKAHVPPNAQLIGALQGGVARSIFLIRRPADVVRSTLAYGEYCRRAGLNEPYAELHQPEDAARFVAPFIDWAEQWLANGTASRVTRYEHLFAADDNILAAIGDLAPDTELVAAAVLSEMRVSKLSQPERDRLRVNLVRRPELSDRVIVDCEDWARRLGYEALETETT